MIVESELSAIEIRKASKADMKYIKAILSFYYLDTESVGKNLPEFVIAVSGNKIVGCACLDMGEVVELRSIAVLPAYRNRGIGSRLADAVLNRAAYLTDAVYLRTTSPVFFEKKGFRRLMPDMKKVIWTGCAECDRFDICRQTLMKIDVFND